MNRVERLRGTRGSGALDRGLQQVRTRQDTDRPAGAHPRLEPAARRLESSGLQQDPRETELRPLDRSPGPRRAPPEYLRRTSVWVARPSPAWSSTLRARPDRFFVVDVQPGCPS